MTDTMQDFRLDNEQLLKATSDSDGNATYVHGSYPDKSLEWALASMLMARFMYIHFKTWTGVLEPFNQIVSPQLWGEIALVISIGRIIALYINGRWLRSSAMRLIFTILAFSYWGMMASVMFWKSAEIPPQIVFPLVYVGWELVAAYRCGADIVATGAFHFISKVER